MSRQQSLSIDARAPELRAYFREGAIKHVALFAGGGGWSQGAAEAGADPDVAINHSPVALAMHAINHPRTKHIVESVWKANPKAIAQGRRVELLQLSPDCTQFSKAKGGKPRNRKIRCLCWSAFPWIKHTRPRVIILENVEEFQDYGPLYRTHSDGCGGDDSGEHCLDRCHFEKPIKARRGETFRAFVRKLESKGYVVEWRLLKACDYGAPTMRRRLFLIARCDGKPIRWPQPTHGPGLIPYRTAAECMDFTIPCPSIFDRAKPLSDNTEARAARGLHEYVMRTERPFLIHLTHGTRGHSLDEPCPTVTGANRGELGLIAPYLVALRGTSEAHVNASASSLEDPLRAIGAQGTHHALVAPYLVHVSNGERPGQAPRIYNIREPLRTVVGQGVKQGLCAAFLVKNHGGHESATGGQDLRRPIDTIASRDQKSLVTAELQPAPIDDITLARARRVAGFMRKHGYDVGDLVTAWIAGAEYVVVDIGFRMLVPRELFNANGFPPDYIIDFEFNGKPLSKSAQTELVGNSVCPPWAKALVAAAFAESA